MPAPAKRPLLSHIAGRAIPSAALADPHTLLQDRVTLFVKVQFLLCTLTFALRVVLSAIAPTADSAPRLDDTVPATIGHAFTCVVFMVTWLYCRRSERSTRVLHGIESVGTVVACVGFAGVVLAPSSTASATATTQQQAMFLFVVLVLITRAALVPSSMRRSLVVGTLSLLPIVVTTFIATGWLVEGADLSMAAYVAGLRFVGGVSFLAVTTVTSRVIYGLQERVREVAKLGQYTLEAKIGEGGMGAVYRAKHTLLRRPTAIKLLPPEMSSAQSLERFEREVQHTSLLTHPNTVEIYDFGHTPDGVFYYVMEYLDGANLEEVVAVGGPQHPGRVIRILAQVASALAEAHTSGLVHRDIKPGNIILVDRGGILDTAKIVDFGLVKDIEAPADVALTAQNAIVGTPLYMAPECATSTLNVDGRSDLYSLGAVGYFLLTGQAVFDGQSPMEVISKHMTQQPVSMSERLGRGVPPDLEAIIACCLQKTPDDRPGSARELERELLACADAGTWSQLDAKTWWADHDRGLKELRALSRGASLEGAAPSPSAALMTTVRQSTA